MEGPVLFVVCIKWMDVGDGKILRCLMDGMLMDGWMDGWVSIPSESKLFFENEPIDQSPVSQTTC
jgi:hypothetical protein